MKAMLLAAGFGKRFQPHTNVIAKPTIPFLTLPLIAYPLYHLVQTGLTELVVNTHHLPNTLLSTTHSYTDEKDFKTHFLHEQPNILDSGGGIANAKKYLSGNEAFFVINADAVFLFKNGETLKKVYDAHVASGALATIMTMPHPEAGLSMGGIELGNDGQILELSTRTRTDSTRHNASVYVYSPEIFDFMPNDKSFHIFDHCLRPALKAGQKIMAYDSDNICWLDMTSEKDYLSSTKRGLRELWGKSDFGKQLEEIFKYYRRSYTQPRPNVWLGSRAELYCTPSDEALVMVGEGSVIHQPVGIKNFAVFGPNVCVDQGFIEESVIASGTHLHEMLALRNQLVLQPEEVETEGPK